MSKPLHFLNQRTHFKEEIVILYFCLKLPRCLVLSLFTFRHRELVLDPEHLALTYVPLKFSVKYCALAAIAYSDDSSSRVH